MAARFPTIYPEEPLFSVIARHAEAMAFPENAALCRDVYGTHLAYPASRVPGGLALLVRHLPPGHPHTAWSLLQDHSPVPYFLPFSRRRLQRPFLTALWTGWPSTNSSGESAIEDGPVPQSLRFCPDCVDQDLLAEAPPVWRRSHQLPGVIVCPEHSAPLLHSGLRRFAKDWPLDQTHGGLGGVLPLEAVHARGGGSYSLDEASREFAAGIARDSLWLLQHWQAWESRGTVLTRLHHTLMRHGLATETGRVNYAGVERILADAAGGFVVAAYHTSEYHLRWTLPRLMDGWRRNAPLAPLDLLVVLRSLGTSVRDFFRGRPPRVRLPRRGWALAKGPCVSPVCERRQPRAALEAPRRWLRVAVVHCHACGTAYAERLGRGGRRLIKLGVSWDEAVRSLLLDPPALLEEAAQQLRLTPGQLAAEAVRLRLWPPGWPAELRALALAPPDRATAEERAERTRHRWYWNRFLRRNNRDLSHFGREQWAELRWLLRHDPAWLTEHFVSPPPPPPPPWNPGPRERWRDDEYWLREHLDKVLYLRGWTGLPLPVTPFVLERFLRPEDLHWLFAYPERRAALEALLESPVDFAGRRLSLAARAFALEGRPASPEALIHRAGLTQSEADAVRAAAQETSRTLEDVLAARAPPPPEWRWKMPGYPRRHAMSALTNVVDTGSDFRYSFGSRWTQAEEEAMPRSRGGPSNIERRRAEGYGEGEGATYRPWETVRSVSSRGMSHRVWGAKSRRRHMLLSDREL